MNVTANENDVDTCDADADDGGADTGIYRLPSRDPLRVSIRAPLRAPSRAALTVPITPSPLWAHGMGCWPKEVMLCSEGVSSPHVEGFGKVWASRFMVFRHEKTFQIPTFPKASEHSKFSKNFQNFKNSLFGRVGP